MLRESLGFIDRDASMMIVSLIRLGIGIAEEWQDYIDDDIDRLE